MEINGLLKGEITLTIDIILGLILGEVIIRLKIADKIMKRFMPRNIPGVTCLALAASFGSSKAGAAIISSALANNTITEREAIYSVLMLALPSYLRRWPSTLALSAGMAGKAGVIFAVSLLVRSTLRFLWVFALLRGKNTDTDNTQHDVKELQYSLGPAKMAKKLMKSLPLAWVLFAVSYSLVPMTDRVFTANFSGSFLPLSGWTVAAGSIAHVSGALAMAGGAMASGELNTTQAVFALVLGSGLGTATRLLRQNAGYYFGLFPVRTAKKMLLMNFATIMPLIVLNVILAGIALCYNE